MQSGSQSNFHQLRCHLFCTSFQLSVSANVQLVVLSVSHVQQSGIPAQNTGGQSHLLVFSLLSLISFSCHHSSVSVFRYNISAVICSEHFLHNEADIWRSVVSGTTTLLLPSYALAIAISGEYCWYLKDVTPLLHHGCCFLNCEQIKVKRSSAQRTHDVKSIRPHELSPS